MRVYTALPVPARRRSGRPLNTSWLGRNVGNSEEHYIAVIVLSVLTVVLPAAGAWLTRQSFTRLRDHERAEGKIIGFKKTGMAKQYYFPIIEVIGADGGASRSVSSNGASEPAYSEGATVAVTHPPGKPGEAEIADFSSLWLFPLVFGVGFLTALVLLVLVLTGNIEGLAA